MSSLFQHFPKPKPSYYMRFFPRLISRNLQLTQRAWKLLINVMKILLTSLNLKAFKYTLKGKKGSSFKSNRNSLTLM